MNFVHCVSFFLKSPDPFDQGISSVSCDFLLKKYQISYFSVTT